MPAQYIQDLLVEILRSGGRRVAGLLRAQVGSPEELRPFQAERIGDLQEVAERCRGQGEGSPEQGATSPERGAASPERGAAS